MVKAVLTSVGGCGGSFGQESRIEEEGCVDERETSCTEWRTCGSERESDVRLLGSDLDHTRPQHRESTEVTCFFFWET